MNKILLVEDDELLIDILKRKLEEEGYECVVARDGEEGLKKVKEEKPDLVLLDIILPKMSGFEVLEAIRKDPEIKETSVMVISNSGQPVELERAKRLGAKDWIIKTEFDPQEVLDKVKKIL